MMSGFLCGVTAFDANILGYLSGTLIDRADVYGDGEVFSYFDGEVITTYMQKKSD